MIYLEIITSIIIFMIMSYLSAIDVAYLSITKSKFNFDIIDNKKKVKRLKAILNKTSSIISSIKYTKSFLDLWLGALIAEIIASPLYKNINFELKNTSLAYFIKYIIIIATALILTYLLYLFAELIPKSLAIKNKEKVVVSTINFIYFISNLFIPITKLAKITESIIIKLFKIDRKSQISYKDSEIKEVVEIGQEMGTLSKHESFIISNFVKLDEMTVGDIMKNIEDAVILDLNDTKESIKNVIINCNYTRIPVSDGDIRNIIGVIDVKSILKNILQNDKISTKNFVQSCIRVSSGKRLDLLFKEMQNSKEYMAIVTKEKNIAVGIITMNDIINVITGNIEDLGEK